MRIDELNCGSGRPIGCRLLRAMPDRMVCRCLVIESGGQRVLIDTGLGTQDIKDPARRLGAMRFGLGLALEPGETAVTQLRGGPPPTSIVLTHLDVDHVGGLADFPGVPVHVSGPELDLATGRSIRARLRYRPAELGDTDAWRTYRRFEPSAWFEFDACRIDLGPAIDARFVRLPGHTGEHCGVAICLPDDRWLLHAGDAYYARAELDPANDSLGMRLFRASINMHPAQASRTRQALQALLARHGDRVRLCNAHDPDDHATG